MILSEILGFLQNAAKSISPIKVTNHRLDNLLFLEQGYKYLYSKEKIKCFFGAKTLYVVVNSNLKEKSKERTNDWRNKCCFQDISDV